VIVVSLVVAALAVARIARLLTEDFLTVGYRRWVVTRWGPESKMSYLVHCPWCTSIWIALPIMPVAVLFPNVWVIATLAIPAASHVAGLLNTTSKE
jgi:hypothetical protein